MCEELGVDDVAESTPNKRLAPAKLAKGLGAGGAWIFAVVSDVTLTEDLVVSGTSYDKDGCRKRDLDAQDTDRMDRCITNSGGPFGSSLSVLSTR